MLRALGRRWGEERVKGRRAAAVVLVAPPAAPGSGRQGFQDICILCSGCLGKGGQ